MTFSFIGKLWVIITVVCLLDTIEPIDGQSPFRKLKKRYQLIPFYDGDTKVSDSDKPALIQDLILLGHTLNDTANTVFGSKDMVRDLLTFFVDLDQLMMLAYFHGLKGKEAQFAKRQPKLPEQSKSPGDVPGESPGVPSPQQVPKGTDVKGKPFDEK